MSAEDRNELRARMESPGGWGEWANALVHGRYMKPRKDGPGGKGRRRCWCCRGWCTHVGYANGLAMTSGCEFAVRRWVRDPLDRTRSVEPPEPGPVRLRHEDPNPTGHEGPRTRQLPAPEVVGPQRRRDLRGMERPVTAPTTPTPPRLTPERWSALVDICTRLDTIANRGAGAPKDAG